MPGFRLEKCAAEDFWENVEDLDAQVGPWDKAESFLVSKAAELKKWQADGKARSFDNLSTSNASTDCRSGSVSFLSQGPPSLESLPSCPECEDETLPSWGSRGHAAGTCTPCKFFRHHRGCSQGADCNLCHYPHEELTYSGIRRAMKLRAMERRRQLAEREAEQPQGKTPSVARRPAHKTEMGSTFIPTALDPVIAPMRTLSAFYVPPPPGLLRMGR